METINSFGFVEVHGFVAGIEAADAMLKSAQVRLLRQLEVRPGFITLVVEGDLAACRAAVSAGVAAATRVGTVISSHTIGCPDEDTESMALELAGRSLNDYPGRDEPPQQTPPAAPVPSAAPVADSGASTTQSHPPQPAKVDAPEPESGVTAADEERHEAVDDELQRVFAFIAASTKGCTWNEIAKRFPKHSLDLRLRLNACVENGTLLRAGPRYRMSESKG